MHADSRQFRRRSARQATAVVSGVVSAALLLAAGGLPVLVSPAHAAGCAVWTDPEGDAGPGGSPGTVPDENMDLREASVSSVDGKVVASWKVTALSELASDFGDVFMITFTMKEKSMEISASRGPAGAPVGESAIFYNLDDDTMGEATAEFDLERDRVTVTGTQAEFAKALGSDPSNQTATELVAATRNSALGQPAVPYDTAETSQTWTVGQACDGIEPTPSASTSGTPTATPTGSGSPSPSTCARQPVLTVLDPEIVTGRQARVRYSGNPGASMRLEAYSRAAGVQPEYRTVRQGVVPESGSIEFVLTPPTNTRLRAVEEGCASPAESVVIRVRLTLSITAQRNGVRDYTFSGRLAPGGPNENRLVTIYYKSGSQLVRKATARVRNGGWSARVTFTRSTRLVMVAASGDDVVNIGARSPERPTTIY